MHQGAQLPCCEAVPPPLRGGAAAGTLQIVRGDGETPLLRRSASAFFPLDRLCFVEEPVLLLYRVPDGSPSDVGVFAARTPPGPQCTSQAPHRL
jgi:hypothetical protein